MCEKKNKKRGGRRGIGYPSVESNCELQIKQQRLYHCAKNWTGPALPVRKVNEFIDRAHDTVPLHIMLKLDALSPHLLTISLV